MKKGQTKRPPTPDYNYGMTRQRWSSDAPSMTKQSEAAACDVNNIIKRYDRTGLITHLARAEAVFTDVSEITSYQDAILQVQDAQKAFMDLPSGLRSRFGNDPAKYIDWATSSSDEEKHEVYAQLTGVDRYTDAAPTPAADPQTGPETGD